MFSFTPHTIHINGRYRQKLKDIRIDSAYSIVQNGITLERFHTIDKAYRRRAKYWQANGVDVSYYIGLSSHDGRTATLTYDKKKRIVSGLPHQPHVHIILIINNATKKQTAQVKADFEAYNRHIITAFPTEEISEFKSKPLIADPTQMYYVRYVSNQSHAVHSYGTFNFKYFSDDRILWPTANQLEKLREKYPKMTV